MLNIKQCSLSSEHFVESKNDSRNTFRLRITFNMRVGLGLKLGLIDTGKSSHFTPNGLVLSGNQRVNTNINDSISDRV